MADASPASMLAEERDGAVVTLTLCNLARRNAFATPMRLSLRDTMARLGADDTVRAVILTGEGSHFCAGGDVSDMRQREIGEGRERLRPVHDLVRLMACGAKPIIAAVEGWAAGAGLALALLCDTVIAGDTARFKAGFGDVGLIADTGLLHTLPARVGPGPAKQILFYGEALSATEARALGIVDSLVPGGTALEVARQRAALLATRAPLPIAFTKAVLGGGGLDAVLAREMDLQGLLYRSSDHREGQAAFLEKRAASFRGQ